jgi:hypothetical protein
MRMTTIKPIIKSTLISCSKSGDLKRKLEDIDPIDEIEEPKSMIFPCDGSIFSLNIFCVVFHVPVVDIVVWSNETTPVLAQSQLFNLSNRICQN